MLKRLCSLHSRRYNNVYGALHEASFAVLNKMGRAGVSMVVAVVVAAAFAILSFTHLCPKTKVRMVGLHCERGIGMVTPSLKIRIYPPPALVPPVAESSVYIVTRVFVLGIDCKLMLAVMTDWKLRLSSVRLNVPCWPKDTQFGSGMGSLEVCAFGISCASLVGLKS